MTVQSSTSLIVDAFEKICRDTPDRPMVYLPAAGAMVTATQLGGAAAETCRALEAAPINPRGLIVAAIGNRLGYLAAFYACRLRNQALLPLDGGTTPAEIGVVARQFGASAILLAAPHQLEGFARQVPCAHGLTL